MVFFSPIVQSTSVSNNGVATTSIIHGVATTTAPPTTSLKDTETSSEMTEASSPSKSSDDVGATAG